MPEGSHTHEKVYENTNGFPMSYGKNLHMDIGHGDLAQRVLTVGAVSRAEKISKYLDKDSIRFHYTSGRGFTTITGTYNSVPVSIVAIGMGLPMMDFFVRESRNVVDGPMAIIRFGTCGGLNSKALPGTVVVAEKGSALILRHPDGFDQFYEGENCAAAKHPVTFEDGYQLSKVAPACPRLSQLLYQELHGALGDSVTTGMNISADSFYSSQGRVDTNFHDYNGELVAEHVCKVYPDVASMEMETFQLFHLARCSKRSPIYASAAAIVVANRLSSDVAHGDSLDLAEEKGGEAVLKALAAFPL